MATTSRARRTLLPLVASPPRSRDEVIGSNVTLPIVTYARLMLLQRNDGQTRLLNDLEKASQKAVKRFNGIERRVDVKRQFGDRRLSSCRRKITGFSRSRNGVQKANRVIGVKIKPPDGHTVQQ